MCYVDNYLTDVFCYHQFQKLRKTKTKCKNDEKGEKVTNVFHKSFITNDGHIQ